MPKRTRDRHLAKLAARRAEERRRKQRKRSTTLGIITAVAVAVLGLVVLSLVTGNQKPKHRASPTPSASPGAQTGTVTPQPAPAKVACGAKAPPEAGKPKPQFAGPPSMTIDAKKTYTATLVTSCGKIVIQLDATNAPTTVNSFVFLADQRYFDGQYFHRIANTIDLIQGGDPTGTGTGTPGYNIRDELKGKEKYGPGVVAMAKAQAPNTGGSQFFVVTGSQGHNLDASPVYAIFGRVIRGLEVAKRIQALPVNGETPKLAVYIDHVTIRVSK